MPPSALPAAVAERGDDDEHPHAHAAPCRRATPGQRDYLAALRERDMVFALGPAGSGKTYLAVAMGVSLLLAGKVERIVLSRPAVEAGERLGFLPGDMKEKIDPYLRPLYDALHDMIPAEQIAQPHGDRARSRSRRWPSCAAAPWRTASSSSTRRRTPRRCRCACS